MLGIGVLFSESTLRGNRSLVGSDCTAAENFFQVHPLLTRKWRQRVEKRLKSPGFIGGRHLQSRRQKV